MREKVLIKIIIILTIILFVFSMVGLFYNIKINNELTEKINNGFYLNGSDEIIVNYGEEFIDEGFVANIEENKSVKDIEVVNNVDTKKVGNYEVTYTMKYKDKTKTLTRIVKVVDKVPPSIELDCKDKTYIKVNSKYKECQYNASDNYDEVVNVSVDSNLDVSKKGDYKITYTATDSSDNKTTKTINIYVRDKKDLDYIEVYISKQRLYYYQNKELVFTTPVTTGRHNATKTGNFKIKNKVRNTSLKGKDYVSHVKYWMGYSGNNYGIHDASWRKRFGTSDYFYNGSHGCINVPTNNMKKLYNMVSVGTPVYIRK